MAFPNTFEPRVTENTVQFLIGTGPGGSTYRQTIAGFTPHTAWFDAQYDQVAYLDAGDQLVLVNPEPPDVANVPGIVYKATTNERDTGRPYADGQTIITGTGVAAIAEVYIEATNSFAPAPFPQAAAVAVGLPQTYASIALRNADEANLTTTQEAWVGEDRYVYDAAGATVNDRFILVPDKDQDLLPATFADITARNTNEATLQQGQDVFVGTQAWIYDPAGATINDRFIAVPQAPGSTVASRETSAVAATIADDTTHFEGQTAAAFDVTLPANPAQDQQVRVTRNGANELGVVANAGQTLLGTTDTYVIDADNAYVDLYYSGTNWVITGRPIVTTGAGGGDISMTITGGFN